MVCHILSLPPPHQRISPRALLSRCALLSLCALLAPLMACTTEPNTPPSLIGLRDLTLSANSTAELQITAADPEQHSVIFEMELSPPPPTQSAVRVGLPRLQQVSPYGAVFTWTPGNADVGVYALSVRVTDSFDAETVETISITVVDSGVGGGDLVRFSEPVGDVVTLDASLSSCLSAPVSLQADSFEASELSLSFGAPPPSGMTLDPHGLKRYTLSWCPSPSQLSERSQYPLMLVATNSRGLPPVEKRLLVRIINARGASGVCAGAPPTLTYAPLSEQYGARNTDVRVTVWDDLGVKGAPTLSYELAPLSQMEPSGAWVERVMEPDFNMELAPGESAWRGLAPPPHLLGSARLFYRVSVSDDDDRESALCDHVTLGEVRSVTSRWDPMDAPYYSPCEPCVADAQCGGEQDLCAPDEASALSGSCARACGPSRSCESGEECRDLFSQDGALVPQCVRVSGCALRCVDDVYEGGGGANNTAEGATLLSGDPAVTLDDLSVCPGDEDFYVVSVPSGGELSVSLSFDHLEGDLDLTVTLQTSRGAISDSSVSATSDLEEASISALCAEGGEAFIKVYGYGSASARYALSVRLLAPLAGAEGCEEGCAMTMDCPAGQRCVSGECVPSACGSASCAPGAACMNSLAGYLPAGASGLCVEPCAGDQDCRPGEACKRFEDFNTYCAPAGASPAGGVCEGFDECAGDMICFYGGVGFCAAGGCDATRPCPLGTACAEVPGGPACVPTCAALGQPCVGGRLTCRAGAQGFVCTP